MVAVQAEEPVAHSRRGPADLLRLAAGVEIEAHLWHWSQADLARASGIQKSQISLYELWQAVPTEANLKRLAAASASGVQRSQISAYELGKKTPRGRTLARLAAAVGVPLDEALNGLPFLRELVRATQGEPRPATPMAEGAGRFAEDLFLLVECV